MKKLEFRIYCIDKKIDFILKNEGKMIDCLAEKLKSEYRLIRSLLRMKVEMVGVLFCYENLSLLNDKGRTQYIEIVEIKQEGKEISFKYDLK